MLYFQTYIILALVVGVLLRLIAFLLPSKSYRTSGGAGPHYPGRRVPIDR